MATKTAIDKLDTAIEKILAEYEGEVTENMGEIVQRIGKAGVSALRQESKEKFNGTGKYAKGWKSETLTSRLGTTVIIYNSMPGLPHLLENGHAKRGGGRVAGVPHISTVEEKLIDDFEKEVTEKL